jgi:serine protease Do
MTVGNEEQPVSGTTRPKPEVSVPRYANKTYGPKKTTLLTVLFLFIVSTSAGFLGGWFGAKHQSLNPQSEQAQQQIISSEGQLINKLVKDVGPSVVSINVTGQANLPSSFFGFDRSVERRSAGTGFIISADGVVITNRHVVPAGTSNVSVVLSDGTNLENVTVIGRTAESDSLDVAFLKINDKKGKELKPVKLGDSTKIQVGDKVIAIGNALGEFQNTVTSGIISGFGRSVEASEEDGTATESLQNPFKPIRPLILVIQAVP